jgi:2-methylisocitrate lyase-like PEP mutase family enzyme
MQPTQHEKGAEFRALHEGEPFVIPNPWDAGSAKVLERVGFKALATTSSGFAFTLGRPDGSVTLRDVLTHTRAVAAAVDVPVSVDLENGYAREPEAMAGAIRGAAAAGAVGGSIEDYDPSGGLYDLDLAVERVAVAARTAHELAFPFTLTARAENHIRGNPDIEDTIARLRAYEGAGADVLYAPGLDADGIRAVRAATTLPINALARPTLDLGELFAAGAQRVSVGGALTWVAANALADATERLLGGDLGALASGDGRRVASLLDGGSA